MYKILGDMVTANNENTKWTIDAVKQLQALRILLLEKMSESNKEIKLLDDAIKSLQVIKWVREKTK